MIKVKEDIKVGNVILEKGDQIRILEMKDGVKSFEAPFQTTLSNGQPGIGIKVDGETYVFSKVMGKLYAEDILRIVKKM